MMNLYECRRWDEEENEHWRGALLIAAQDEEDASELFVQNDEGEWQPEKIVKLATLSCEDGEAYVVYDDYCR